MTTESPAGGSTTVADCPKCRAHFEPPRPEVSECPQCGIWFHKLRPATPDVASAAQFDPEEILAAAHAEKKDPLGFWGRLLVLCGIVFWGTRIAANDFRGIDVYDSFMHSVLLPIHEAGHVFLMPFGEFLHVLGGSLFQVALPLGIGLAFLLRQRDAFGAAVCLWWAGAAIVDLAPYVWDALDPQLMLISGRTGEEGGHDWIYLLEHFGVRHRAHAIGTLTHRLGCLVMIAGLGWGAGLLWRERPGARSAAA